MTYYAGGVRFIDMFTFEYLIHHNFFVIIDSL